LEVSATCDGVDLVLRVIAADDAVEFSQADAGAHQPLLPTVGVGEVARILGPDLWTDVIGQETAGDRQIVELGDFDCAPSREAYVFGSGFEGTD
jgi:hypothetical protein